MSVDNEIVNKALEVLIYTDWSTHHRQVLEILFSLVASLSRDRQHRASIQLILPQILTQLNKDGWSKETRMYMLRCVGNLVADDDDNRETIITHNIMDGLANTVKGLQSPEEADLSVNVTFNICNDYAPAQKHALEHGLDIALVDYISRKYSDLEGDGDPPEDPDDPFLTVALNLLEQIVLHKQELKQQIPSETDSSWIEKVLRLTRFPRIYMDKESFFAAAAAVTAYLGDCEFLKPDRFLNDRTFRLLFDLLYWTSHGQQDADINPGYDAVASFVASLSNTITTISLWPEFTAHRDKDDPLLQFLCSECSKTSRESYHYPFMVPAHACLMLGNYAITDENAIDIADNVKWRKLFEQLGKIESTFDNDFYVRTVADFLRNLAKPQRNRKLFADESRPMVNVLDIYNERLNPDLQIAGVRLARQLLMDEDELVERFIKHWNRLPDLVHLFNKYHKEPAQPEAARLMQANPEAAKLIQVQVEIARLLTTLLRSLRRIAAKENWNPAVKVFREQTDILLPLAFAATLPDLPTVHSEAWLALNLVTLLPEATPRVAAVFAQYPKLLDTAAGRIKEGKPVEESKRMDWDNTLALCCTLLDEKDLPSAARTTLQTALQEANISFQIPSGR